MNLLVFDTSSAWLTIALEAKGDVRFLSVKSGERQSDILMKEIDKIMDSAGIKTGDLDAVGCILGPGYFTGLRGGIAVAKAMAFTHSIPVVGLTYPECFESEDPVVLVRKARKGWWYVSEFNGETWDYSLHPTEELSGIFAGKKVVSEDAIDGTTVEAKEGPIVCGIDILKSMKKAFESGKNVYDHISVKPFYVQRPLAEMNLENKGETK